MGGWYVTGLLKTVFSKCSSLLPKNCREGNLLLLVKEKTFLRKWFRH